MQANQTRFIHGRKYKDFWKIQMHENGGFTVAWKINDQYSLIVSAPARCLDTDRFERKIGAQIASKNMAEKDPLFVLTKDEIIEDSVKVYTTSIERIGDLTPNARVALVAQYRELLQNDFSNSVTSRMIEELARNKLREMYNTRDGSPIYGI